MGVYIKGMKMPYGCANCHFVSKPIYDSKGRAIYVCNVPVEEVCGKGNTDEVIALYEGASEAFPNWCPLVEVPESHGWLIDVNDVKSRMIPLSFSVQKWIGEVELSNCKTVIEAEGE